MCLYLYIHNKYTVHINILCKQKLLFWMQLIAINRLTALKKNQLTFISSNDFFVVLILASVLVLIIYNNPGTELHHFHFTSYFAPKTKNSSQSK